MKKLHKWYVVTSICLLLIGGGIYVLFFRVLPEERITNNEITAVTNMVSLVNAQATFKRKRWYANSGKGFANGARDLYKLASNPDKKPNLIDKSLADAFGTTAGQMVSGDREGKAPMAGYIYVDLSKQSDGVTSVDLTDPSMPISHIAYCAYPAEYGVTGKQTFICEMSGTVYGEDNGGKPIMGFPVPTGEWGWGWGAGD